MEENPEIKAKMATNRARLSPAKSNTRPAPRSTRKGQSLSLARTR